MTTPKHLLRCSVTAFILIAFSSIPTVAQTIWYVDADATGSNNGTSWGNACRELQSALSVASADDEIWVAAGTYKPDYDVGGGKHTGYRTATFQLKNGVGLYGGFAGTETQRDQRYWLTNVTILSGDLADNDGPDFTNNEENSYHVTTGSSTDATAILDGFKITAGNSNGDYPHNIGAGMYNYQGSPTIANNTITANSAYDGGGIYCYYSSPTIANNTITGNSTTSSGSGIYCEFSSPTVVNNTITANNSDRGGGIYCEYSSPTIANNTITGNSTTYYGGGIDCNWYSSPTIANNTITSNNSAAAGGGIDCNWYSSPTIANNAITGNSASYRGGGICCFFDSSPTIVNTIVAFNSSGIYKTGSDTLTLRYNCVYGNTAYNYSGITDPTGTNGNVSEDPLFVDKDGGDYRLVPGSPCIDAGGNEAVPEGVTTDLAGNPRFVDDPDSPNTGNGTPPIVDMGAYEFQPTPRIIHIYQDNGAVRDGAENINPDGPASIGARTKGITICTMEFSEDVDIQASDVQIRDVNDSIDLTWPSTFKYDTATHTLTMGWPVGTFKNMWVRIHILDTVTSVATGLALDGEIYAETGNPASGLVLDGELPSGDGTPGGDAQFVIGALQGDVDGNRIVNSFDRLRVSQNQGITADIPSDVDGNGIVNSFDRLRTNQNQGSFLPTP